MAEDLICIRRTTTVEEADIIVAWLGEQGIDARVMDHDNPGVMAFGVTDFEGFSICVADAETADRAKVLLAQHDREHAPDSGHEGTSTVDVTCDECGQVNSFPEEYRGSVQECHSCGTYVDVPGDEA